MSSSWFDLGHNNMEGFLSSFFLILVLEHESSRSFRKHWRKPTTCTGDGIHQDTGMECIYIHSQTAFKFQFINLAHCGLKIFSHAAPGILMLCYVPAFIKASSAPSDIPPWVYCWQASHCSPVLKSVPLCLGCRASVLPNSQHWGVNNKISFYRPRASEAKHPLERLCNTVIYSCRQKTATSELGV